MLYYNYINNASGVVKMTNWDLKRLNTAKAELKKMQDAVPFAKEFMKKTVYPGLIKNIQKKMKLIEALEKHVQFN